jgi:hypothetical protein
MRDLGWWSGNGAAPLKPSYGQCAAFYWPTR